MQPIVVPVNYTANSANAARYAADLARSIEADIHLINVFEIPVSISEVPMPESAFEELQQGSVNLLNNIKKELVTRTKGEVKVYTDIETGNVEGRLEDFCKEKDPLLVVMGASGDRLENVLAGSNTVRAVRHLSYPVLVIPENAGYHAMAKIVVACEREDLLQGLPGALPFLQRLSAKSPGVRLEVMHVVTGKDEATAELMEAYNEWKGEVAGLAPELNFVRRSNVEEGIEEYLRGCGADLLMVFPKSHGLLDFHKSHSKRMVLHCAVPVMSVHE